MRRNAHLLANVLQILELLLANALFQRLAGRQISKRRIAGGNICLDDQRIGVFELFEQTGGQEPYRGYPYEYCQSDENGDCRGG